MEKPAPDEQPWQWIMSVTELLMALTCSHMPLDGPHMPLEPSSFPISASEQLYNNCYLDLSVSNTDVPIPPDNGF